eukprot:gene3319-4178_t
MQAMQEVMFQSKRGADAAGEQNRIVHVELPTPVRLEPALELEIQLDQHGPLGDNSALSVYNESLYAEKAQPDYTKNRRKEIKCKVQHLDMWLRRQLVQLNTQVMRMEEKLAKELSERACAHRADHHVLEWTLRGHGHGQRLQYVIQFRDLYNTAFMELVRQLGTHSTDQAELLGAMWGGVMQLLEMCCTAVMHAGKSADSLQKCLDRQVAQSDMWPPKLAKLQEELEETRKNWEWAENRKERAIKDLVDFQAMIAKEKKQEKRMNMRSMNMMAAAGIHGALDSMEHNEVEGPLNKWKDKTEGKPTKGGALWSKGLDALKAQMKKEKHTKDLEEMPLSLEETRVMEEDLARLTDEVARLTRAFEDAQINEEEAWKEARNFESQMWLRTPRPLATCDPSVQALFDRVPTAESTAARMTRLELEVQRLMELCRSKDVDTTGDDDATGQQYAHGVGGMVTDLMKQQRRSSVASRKKRHSEIAQDNSKLSTALFQWEDALEAVTARNKGYPVEQFKGIGEEPQVPRWLKTSSFVKNRDWTKRQTEKLVWSKFGKRADEGIMLAEVLGDHFAKNIGSGTPTYEAGYNFLCGLKTYEYDADCEMFLKVLIGEVSPDVHREQLSMCKDLQYLLLQVDLDANGGKKLQIRRHGLQSGKLQYKDCEASMRALFHQCTEAEFKELLLALEKDQEDSHPQDWANGRVAYPDFFVENADFDQGPFAEAVRDMHLKHRQHFTKANALGGPEG